MERTTHLKKKTDVFFSCFSFPFAIKYIPGNIKEKKKRKTANDFPFPHEVFLDYDPQKLHDYRNDFSLAPDNLTVNNVKKKNPYLGLRQKYVLTIEYLRLSLQLGIKVNISRDYIQ